MPYAEQAAAGAGPFSLSSSLSLRFAMALPKGSWEVSTTTEEEIDYLRSTRWLPPVDALVTRLPDGERVPAPRDGEHVVFFSHFERGFGLPASLFFRDFLNFFGL